MTSAAPSNDPRNLSANDLLAEESHSGRIWVAIILLALILPMVSLTTYRSAAVVWFAIPVGLLALGCGAMAWSGFQYRFFRHGVEIRMLGFHLRSIPKSSILSYSIEPWSVARGYGIRGIGKNRAYVWCNQVVHIKTTNGEIFLGHKDPQRVILDLDRVMAK
jgi:hypothetical protein